MERRAFLRGAALAGAGGAALAAPAIAQERIEMTIVSTWGRDFPGLGTSAQRLAARIPEITDGRIQTEYFASKERVDTFDVFDHTAEGKAQAYIGADYYWKGSHPAWAYFTAVPFGLTFPEIDAWMRFGGGQELMDEVGDDFGIKGFPCGNTGVQMGGWFRKEVETADDLADLTMRIPGLGGDVMAKLGVATVSLGGTEIFENLNNGQIDATEWVGPWNDEALKLYQAARYYYYPGMHEPGAQLSMGMNKSWWSSLNPTDQALIEAACGEENSRQVAETNWRNGAALQRLIDDHGVELREFSDEIYESFGEAAEEVFDEVRQHSALANKVHESFLEARQSVGNWMSLADVAYSNKRNAVLGL
ncbi:MAG: TRAP transporter substrate-binding protein [Pseudomonadota bacterium]